MFLAQATDSDVLRRLKVRTISRRRSHRGRLETPARQAAIAAEEGPGLAAALAAGVAAVDGEDGRTELAHVRIAKRNQPPQASNPS